MFSFSLFLSLSLSLSVCSGFKAGRGSQTVIRFTCPGFRSYVFVSDRQTDRQTDGQTPCVCVRACVRACVCVCVCVCVHAHLHVMRSSSVDYRPTTLRCVISMREVTCGSSA